MTNYRVGIIGCGRISRNHVAGYNGIEGVAVIAGADPVKEGLDKFGAEFGITQLYTDYKEMLAKERLDIVSVCTWPPMHHQMVLDAAAAGVKAIFCEKPVATNLRETDEMVAACEKSGTLLVVNHQRRFLAPYRTAAELIDAGEIGELQLIHSISVGDLLTDATHTIDLMRFYNKDEAVNWVFAAVDTSEIVQRYGHIKEKGALVSLEFANGVRGLMEYGHGAAQAVNAYQKFLITGSKGTIDVKGDYEMSLTLRKDGEMPREIVTGAEEKSRNQPFRTEVQKALEILEKGGGEHPLSGKSSRINLEILIAAFESARQRRLLELPISVQGFPLEDMIDPASIIPEIEDDKRRARLGA